MDEEGGYVPDQQSVRLGMWSRGGVRVGRGSLDAIVDLLADEVDAEGDKGDAEARGRVAELIAQHRVLPPLVPPPEELSCVLSWTHFLSLLSFSLCSFLPLLLFSDTNTLPSHSPHPVLHFLLWLNLSWARPKPNVTISHSKLNPSMTKNKKN